MSLNISQDAYLDMQNKQYYAMTNAASRKYTGKTTSTTTTNTTTSTSTNTCTDGNDDGKIGFFSAIGHAVKGAVKGVANGIKGCFTNSEGKFSLGKTLLTVATGALCIAFPAVGLVACGVGAVMGGVNLCKGVYNAATAETDAEAKDAWEQIGDGTFTVASSVLGAKASLKAVKATSTAGAKDVDDVLKAVDKLDDVSKNNFLDKIDDIDDLAQVTKAAKEVGADTSKLGNLASDASKLDKLKALGSDMASSTKNQAGVVGTKITSAKESAKTTKDAKTYNKNQKQIDELNTKKSNGTITESEKATLEKLAKENNELLAKEGVSAKAQELNQKQGVNFGEFTQKSRETASKTIKGVKGKITETYNNNIKGKKVTEVVSDIRKADKRQGLSELYGKLSNQGKSIYKALTQGDYSYPEVVSQYGYENTMQVIEAVQGYIYAKETV